MVYLDLLQLILIIFFQYLFLLVAQYFFQNPYLLSYHSSISKNNYSILKLKLERTERKEKYLEKSLIKILLFLSVLSNLYYKDNNDFNLFEYLQPNLIRFSNLDCIILFLLFIFIFFTLFLYSKLNLFLEI